MKGKMKKRKPTESKMVDLHPNISTITLNENGVKYTN